MSDYRLIEVHDAQLDSIVGHFSVYRSRGDESYAFTYADAYLRSPNAYDLDTHLERDLRSVSSQSMFAAFTDCSPDRWGRTLMQRAADGPVRESDYLLGVNDTLRQGALRFRENGAWLSAQGVVPKFADLPAVVAMARDADDSDDDQLHNLSKRLLMEGTSALGGAHPKATVRDDQGTLYVAKLALDGADSRALRTEFVTMQTASESGLTTVEPKYLGGVFLVPRFDRTPDGKRIAYASAKTLLGSREGETVDYLDIASMLESHGGQGDLQEMWKRIAFSVLVNNTDDHARNHGVLRDQGRWRLSPVFDVNPDFNPRTPHATTLDGKSSAHEMSVALAETSDVFNVPPSQAREFVSRASEAIQASQLPAAVKEFTANLSRTVTGALGSVPSSPMTPVGSSGAQGVCVYCGKPLSDPVSVQRGYGDTCGKKHGM